LVSSGGPRASPRTVPTPGGFGCIEAHRSYNQGLISADRSNKATLLRTIPRCLLSRLQRISRAQCSKLLFINQARGLSPGPVAKLYGTGRSYHGIGQEGGLSCEVRLLPRLPRRERCLQEGRCKASWKREFKLPWREAGPPDQHDDTVDSDQ